MPGIKGVGPVGAVKLLKQFGSLKKAVAAAKAGDAIEGIQELLKPGVLANNLTETLIRRKYHLLKRAGMNHEKAIEYVRTHVDEILNENTEKKEKRK